MSDLDKQRRLVEACKSAIQKIESGAHFDWFVRDKLLKELRDAVEAVEHGEELSLSPHARD